MLAPLLRLDSKEAWRPVSVDDSLALFGYTWEHSAWERAGQAVSRIDLPKEMAPSDFADLPNVGYHRTMQGGGLYWQQFWTWWPYNPKKYAGFGEHEGDWEFCQLGTVDVDGEDPILMTCSQHDGGEKREYWRCNLEHGRPLVQVARGSHANYFEAGSDVTDQRDGKGQILDLEWHEFDTWAAWPGQWGNSSNSPGPLATRRAWMAPHAWHGQARG